MTEDLAQIERLLAHAVASEVQDLIPRIPQREREHAHRPPQSIIDAPLRNGRKKDFGIALTPKAATRGMQLQAQFLKIVNFPIKRYPETSRVVHGLPPGVGQINDRQASMG
jgi:hypothetical protein